MSTTKSLKPALQRLRTIYRGEQHDWHHLSMQIEQGLPFETVTGLQELLQLSLKELADTLGIPERTLLLRKKQGQLPADESNQVYRLTRILNLTLDLFDGDVESTRRWLKEPCLALSNRIPLTLVHNGVAARAVENIIGRLTHGVYT